MQKKRNLLTYLLYFCSGPVQDTNNIFFLALLVTDFIKLVNLINLYCLDIDFDLILM